jgi:hypothetical protein
MEEGGWPAGRSTTTSSNPLSFLYKNKLKTNKQILDNFFCEIYFYFHMGSVRK